MGLLPSYEEARRMHDEKQLDNAPAVTLVQDYSDGLGIPNGDYGLHQSIENGVVWIYMWRYIHVQSYIRIQTHNFRQADYKCPKNWFLT